MAGAVADGVGSAGLAGLAGAGTPAAGAPPAVAVNLQVNSVRVAPEQGGVLGGLTYTQSSRDPCWATGTMTG